MTDDDPTRPMATEAEHYHVGIVVPDLAEAQARMTELLGIAWGPVMHLDGFDVRDGDGHDLVLPSTLCYSTSAPHLELIEEVPGSVWACNEHSNLHHIGFWSGALTADSQRLSAAACPLQICGRAGDRSPVSFAYHRDPLGVRIELVDSAIRDTMTAMLFTAPEG
jgi:catechol 2,3-dioxygenase-like lactoylglutathione lyase family enzyme